MKTCLFYPVRQSVTYQVVNEIKIISDRTRRSPVSPDCNKWIWARNGETIDELQQGSLSASVRSLFVGRTNCVLQGILSDLPGVNYASFPLANEDLRGPKLASNNEKFPLITCLDVPRDGSYRRQTNSDIVLDSTAFRRHHVSFLQ